MQSGLFRAYLALQLVAIAVFAVLPDGWLHVGWQVAIGWSAAAFVVVGMRHHRPEGAAAWYLFGAGVFLNATGILVANVLERVHGVVESPTAADAFWLCLYPGLLGGMALIIRRRTVGRDWSTLVDTITISTGLGLLSWVFIIRPQAIDASLQLLARATVAAYPIGDLLVLAMMVRLLVGGGTRSPSFLLMLAALLGFLGADVGWAAYSQLGLTPPVPMQRAFEMGSLLAYTLVGASAVHPSVREVARPAPPRDAALGPVLLAGLTVASLMAPAVLVYQALRRQITDGIAIALSSAVLFMLVVIRMAMLLRRIQQRTRELDQRNRSARRVLDTVAEGLVTVSADGRLAQERSAMIDRWFGAYHEPVRFADYLRPVDPDFAEAFALGHEALIEGTLPAALCLDQLPTRLRAGDRHYRVGYLPIQEDGQPHGLLVVIEDVTEQRELARQDARQRELLALFTAFNRDRHGFLAFFGEATQIVERAVWDAEERVTQKRLIHTLKGNASLAGLHLIAELCHAAEDQLEEPDAPPVPPGILALRARWLELAEAFRELVGEARRDVIELPARELDELCDQLGRGLPLSAVAAGLTRLRSEPVADSLQRLAHHARSLAQQLGKGEVSIEVEVEDGELRLDPRRWGPLWAEMVHVVRNAVDHGFETQEERRAAGKPAGPRLHLAAHREDAAFTIEIEDDGRGIDWSAIERAAAARGLPAGTQADLLAALLADGISSRELADTISGRGVGLAAVKARVQELAGTMAVSSTRGAGTRWRFSFPLN